MLNELRNTLLAIVPSELGYGSIAATQGCITNETKGKCVQQCYCILAIYF